MLQQGNVWIRPLKEEDIAILADWQTAEFRGLFQECQIESPINLRRQLEEDGFCAPSFQMLMVENEGTAMGLVYLNFVREGLVRIGLVMDKAARGKRFGSTVLMMCREYLLENYPVVRIEADTDVENIAAQKMLEHCRFCAEGILRKYRFHHGKYHDSYLYSYVRD